MLYICMQKDGQELQTQQIARAVMAHVELNLLINFRTTY
jgi:hypothetical protein